MKPGDEDKELFFDLSNGVFWVILAIVLGMIAGAAFGGPLAVKDGTTYPPGPLELKSDEIIVPTDEMGLATFMIYWSFEDTGAWGFTGFTAYSGDAPGLYQFKVSVDPALRECSVPVQGAHTYVIVSSNFIIPEPTPSPSPGQSKKKDPTLQVLMFLVMLVSLVFF